MSDTKARARAESLFHREKRREAEIADALKQEQIRHDNVIRNMQRLRDLRLSRDAKRGGNNRLDHEFEVLDAPNISQQEVFDDEYAFATWK